MPDSSTTFAIDLGLIPDVGDDTGGQAPSCEHIEISLVLDPAAPAYDPASQQALADAFDQVVLRTGATVRVLTNVGTEAMWTSGCSSETREAIVTWGTGFLPDPSAQDTLGCQLSAAQAYATAEEPGNYMFSGLMFPVLERDDWPRMGSIGLAVMLAATDDMLGGMYSRPGMTSEAWIRLVGGGDRRRVAAFTMGRAADELELFALSLGDASAPTSVYADTDLTSLSEALPPWIETVVEICESQHDAPPPAVPQGCKHLDVLFVIDGSDSMRDEQNALRGLAGEPPVLAEFSDALVTKLGSLEDVHVGVVSSEPGDTTLHVSRDAPELPPGPVSDCGLPAGRRWLVGPSPSLQDEFSCIAATASDNTVETTTLNAAEALHQPENAGFLRGDSIVLVVMLTDEDTQDFETSMVAIRSRMLEAVGGDLRRLVVLGIAGDQGVFEAPKTICNGPYGRAAPGRRVASIVRSLRERGLLADICGPSLSDTFERVLGDVIRACETYQPNG